MKYLTPRLLVFVTALSFTAAWAANLLSGRLGGPLLALPWAVGVALLLEAATLFVVGLQIRRIRDGDREIRMDRAWGAATASLAQANAVVGAMLAGWHGLLVIDQVTLLTVRSNHGPLWLVIGMTVVGVVLAVVGWIVENFCRLPPDDPEDTHDSQGHPHGRTAQEGGMARVVHRAHSAGRRPQETHDEQI